MDEAPYRADQSPTFTPFRRDVRYADAQAAPICPLLSFAHGKANWAK